MSCNCNSGSGPILLGEGGVTVVGSGTPTSPYKISQSQTSQSLALEVRDSGTVNMTIFGSGSRIDPYILKADTSSASSLRGLSDVSPTPTVSQGVTPIWIGSPAGGRFEFRLPGTRYTTNATRGSGLYQGEVIRETDTGKRYEWDGSQWVDLSPAYVPPTALDPSVLANAGTLDQNSVDWNTLTSKSGIYRVGAIPSNVNAPQGAYNFGTLTVFVSGNSVTQVYWTHQYARMYSRTKWNAADWNGWTLAATLDDISNLRNELNGNIAKVDQARDSNYQYLNGRIQQEINDRSYQDGQLSGRIDGVYNQYDGGRLDGRYFTQGVINDAFSQRDNNINGRTFNNANAARVAAGNALVNNFTSNGNGGFSGYVDVAWPGLSLTSVVATAQSLDTRGVIAQVGNISNNGCRVMVVRPNNAATGIDWIAFGN